MAEGKSTPVARIEHTLTPHLICKDALTALEFYKKAFAAQEELRLVGPDGQLVHASLRIGNSRLMLAEENVAWGSLGPKSLNGSPVSIHLIVDDVDAAMSKAVAAGATVTMPAADMFWGDRYGQLADPFGHRWALAAHIRDLSQQEMQEAMMKAFSSPPQ